MSVLFNSFLFIFFIAFAIDTVMFGLSISHLVIIFICAAFTTAISYKLKIIKKDSELTFLYLNLYSLILNKYFTDFVKMILQLHKPFLLDFKASPTIFKVQIKNHDQINKLLLTSIINMSQGLLAYSISKDIILIYCLHERDYGDLNILRLTKDINDINDNSLV